MSLTFGHVMLSKLYGAAWRLARPILRRNRRLADGFARRLVPDDWAGPTDLWLQAASGGEAYLVWELLRALPLESLTDRRPLSVLATTWTRQGLEVLQGMAAALEAERPGLSVRVTLFPLDQPNLMFRAVRMAQPRLVVLLETELWPGLLMACTRRRVPVLVLNGRLSPRGAKGYRLLGNLAPGFWRAVGPKRIAAISCSDANRYAALVGTDRVTVLPNIKFDRALGAPRPAVSTDGGPDEGTSPETALACLLPPAGRPGRVLLASVREQEEPLLLPVIRRLRGNGVQVIIAPRHLHRAASWESRLREAGMDPRPRSGLTAESPARPGEVLIWDAFGELAALYGLAEAVFVGGSLAPLGGQNFLEPLSRGRIPCTGPHLDNFAWALGPVEGAAPEAAPSLQEAGLLEVCADAGMLADRLLARLDNPVPADRIATRFRAWLAPRLGGTAGCAKLITEELEKPVLRS